MTAEVLEFILDLRLRDLRCAMVIIRAAADVADTAGQASLWHAEDYLRRQAQQIDRQTRADYSNQEAQ